MQLFRWKGEGYIMVCSGGKITQETDNTVYYKRKRRLPIHRFEDITCMNLHYIHHMCLNIGLCCHMRKQQGDALSSHPNQGNLHPV